MPKKPKLIFHSPAQFWRGFSCVADAVVLAVRHSAYMNLNPDDIVAMTGRPVAVIVLEGWSLALPPQAEAALAEPANALEAAEDGDGRWRAFVNGQLATAYRDWFALIDYLVVLQAPSFDCIQQWRSLQEQKLAARSDGPRIMDAAQLARFMQHYERLTRHCLAVLPALADAVFLLDRDHGVCGRR